MAASGKMGRTLPSRMEYFGTPAVSQLKSAMTSHKKPGVAFWATVVVVVVLVAYPLSFGPACWLCEKGALSQRIGWTMFRPVTWLVLHGPRPVSSLIQAYAEACGDQRRTESVFTNPSPAIGGTACSKQGN